MTDNWACSKIISHLGKRCTCGGCFNLKHKKILLILKDLYNTKTNVFINMGKDGCEYMEYIAYHTILKYGTYKYIFKKDKSIKNPIIIYFENAYVKNSLNRKYLKTCNPSKSLYDVELIFILCPKCKKKVLLQYKLSTILGK